MSQSFSMSKSGEIKKINLLILGGGISGIFLGLKFLQKKSLDFLILEKEDRLGGLCRSFKIGESYYDIGAHALHKKAIESSNELNQFIHSDQLSCQKRNAKVFIFNKLIPHPFQLHLFYTPWKIKLKCLIGYLTRPKADSDSLFDWLQAKFGKQVCKYFLFPYNEKAWKTDLKNISTNWVSRVSSGSTKFFKGLFMRGDQNYSSNEHVCYPNTGGFENLFLDDIEKLRNHFLTESEVIKIDLKKKIIRMKDGDVYQYEHLISTLPVNHLIKNLATDVDENMIKLTDQLEKVSTCLVTFLTAKHPSTLQRIYVPDKKYFAQRIIINSNSSPYLKNQNESIFSLEISYKHITELPEKGAIISNCKELLKDLNLIKNEDDIRDYRIEYFEYMYPTQTMSLEHTMSTLKQYLKGYNCYTMGRFGSWNYANIDGILNEATDLIEQNFNLPL